MNSHETLDELLGREVVVTIDKLGWRGEGLARVANGWLSIRGGHAGERVRARVADRRASRGHAYAILTDVIEASPLRAEPHCDAFPRCAGCHLRHFRPDDEQALKREWFDEILGRYAPDHTRPAPGWVGAPLRRDQGSRQRGTLTVQNGEAGIRIPGESTLQPMTTCNALIPRARRVLRCVEEALEDEDGWIDWIAPADQSALINLRLDAPASVADRIRGDELGVFVDGEHRHGPDHTTLVFGEHTFQIGIGGWTHTTDTPANALYAWLSGMIAGESVLDLGVGIGGASAVALETGVHRLVGADRDLDAVRAATANLDDDRVKIIAGEFEKVARRLVTAGERFDTTLINPMREPIGERTVSYIERLTARRLIYLAPSPVSAAKDMNSLRPDLWELTEFDVIDLHPGTYHFMGALVFDRRK